MLYPILEKGIARPEGTSLAASFGSGHPRMVIITEFGCLVHDYVDRFSQLDFPLTITAAISLVIGLYPGFFMSFVHAVLP